MTPSSSEAASPSVGKIMAAALIAAVVGLYLTGYFFLWATRQPPQSRHAPDGASLLVLPR